VISTNAFATRYACLINPETGKKSTYDTGRLPERVVMDWEFLKQQINQLGLSDVLSICTALHDWDLAEKVTPTHESKTSYRIAKSILEELMCKMSESEFDLTPEDIFHFVLLSALITNYHGSGRPESGSEHLFSKTIELLSITQSGISIPHGIAVGFGILIMAKLQNNPHYDLLKHTYLKLGFLNQQAYVDKNITKQGILTIKPHEKRHSIVDEKRKDLGNQGFVEDLISESVGEFI
jgi:glycerol dehydrogenase-like iron-containing ADH family enzyme